MNQEEFNEKFSEKNRLIYTIKQVERSISNMNSTHAEYAQAKIDLQNLEQRLQEITKCEQE